MNDPICIISDAELTAWMDAEVERLGEHCGGFELTWHRDERYHWLEMWSLAELSSDHPSLTGSCIRIMQACDGYGASLDAICAEGRRLYYQLRRDYRIRRNLGR